ncbi:hypothetical protein M422DRAFT_777205 [Sphaerobolus stellatus SS14]|nr:hypothetical protein M422DRAFT_777205 [Sphaerobolus stellatus SS14]
MPLLKSNPNHNSQFQGGNQSASVPPASNASAMNGFQAQNNDFNNNTNGPQAGMQTAPSSGMDGRYDGNLDPAARPFGVHDSNALNAPGATTQVHGATIPAAGVTKGASGASEKAFIGKLEHAAGTILCSSSLKAKGIQKEREAQALKVQAAELSAAERLEQEARMRRERAVAHGADPLILHQGPGGQKQQQQQGQQSNMHNTAVSSGAQNAAGVGSGPGHVTGHAAPHMNTHSGDAMGLNENIGAFGGNSNRISANMDHGAQNAAGVGSGPGHVTGHAAPHMNTHSGDAMGLNENIGAFGGNSNRISSNMDHGAQNAAGVGSGPGHATGHVAPHMNTHSGDATGLNENNGAFGGNSNMNSTYMGHVGSEDVSQAGNTGFGNVPHAAHMQASAPHPYSQGDGKLTYLTQNQPHGFAGESAYPPISAAQGY